MKKAAPQSGPLSRNFTRRKFISSAAAVAGLFQIVPRHVIAGSGLTPPSEKLNVAVIGLGWMGKLNLKACSGENIVALCDVDHDFAAEAFQEHPKAAVYKDYRVMLEQQKDIEAVLIATPDHTHAVISKATMQAGKHIFCQKPLTHDIYEARTLARIAKETGVVSQMGIQGHSQEGLRLICEWIWDGAIGPVREVDAYCSLSYAPHGHAKWSSPLSERPKVGQVVPSTLDWDLWIGPAPMRPYHSCYHPIVWRCWWDFGCGMMGDRGAHTLDPIYSALKLTAPESIEASEIVGGNDEVHPAEAVVHYQFPARGDLPPVRLNWYEGREAPRPKELEEGRGMYSGGGAVFKGDKGAIICGVYGNNPQLIPRSAMQAYNRPEKTLPRIKGSHENNWLQAIKEGKRASADFSYSGPLTEIALLGNVAKRFPYQKLLWDHDNMRISNLDEANAWVRRPYREGWSL
ncbi:MAG: Gfo/Idh/MocA family oxidoreductase [Opitutales bacterium]